MRRPCVWGLLAALCLMGGALPARAHPVPKGSHDRTIVVRPSAEGAVVEYRLEVDPWTVVFEDLQAINAGALGNLSSADEFYGAFTRLYAPLLAAGLTGSLDGGPLSFVCSEHRYQKMPDHVRADFVFRAVWKLRADAPQRFTFREGNFAGKTGKVQLTLAAGAGVRLRSAGPLPAGLTADEFARTARTRIELGDSDSNPPGPTAFVDTPPEKGKRDWSLLGLFMGSEPSLWVLLMAAFLGAVHALTPGHGKTLVAAYLVGERGTVWHAIFLGLVTTLTHTGVVLILALVLRLKYPNGIPVDELGGIQRALELGGGVLIAGLGFWLLLRRLSGQADHFHFGGSGHHHHHGPHDHAHPVQGGWWGLVTLGVSGGMVPCLDAVAVLLAAVLANKLWWALPLLLAFSAGLAGVLVVIGILVVRTKLLAGKRLEGNRFFRALPLVSSILVTCLGLGLCYKSVHGG